MKPLVRFNIKIKLIIFLSVILLIVCATLSSFFAFYSIELFEDDLQKRGLSEASNLAIESKFGTLTEDAEILMPLLVKKLNNPDILYIEVRNNDNKIIASAYRYQPVFEPFSSTKTVVNEIENTLMATVTSAFLINETSTNVNFFKITVPILSSPVSKIKRGDNLDVTIDLEISAEATEQTVDERFLGEVRMGISLTRIEEKTHDVLKFISFSSFAILLIALVLAYVLARRALAPILTMSDIATQIASSDLNNVSFSQKAMALINQKNNKELNLIPRSRDEIGLLAEAFIKMSHRLKDYGQDLEHEVQERTEELSLALQQSTELKATTESINKQLLDANHQLQLFRRCIEETSDFILITDPQGRVHTCNQSFLDQNGYTSEQVKQHSLRSFFAPSEIDAFNTNIWPEVKHHGEWHGESLFHKSSSLIYPVDLSITSVSDDQQNIIAYICISRDRTLQQQQQQELMQLASRDALTGLLNRRRFLEELDKEIIRCQRQQSKFALCWLDLDQFKDVNDSMGHQAGDELLIKLAHYLQDLIREADIIARLGGDEFAILLRDVTLASAQTSVERLINGIRLNLITINEQPVRILASIGVALFPSHATTSHDLIACADIALYKSKDAGRNQFNIFHPDDRKQDQSSHHGSWNQRIWDAINEDRLVLFHQAIVDVRTGQTAHYELLLRMLDEQGNIILPGAFIKIAERSAMINEIDRWVVSNAIRLYARSELCQNQCKITINLSAKALSDESFPGYIEAEFAAIDVDPRMFIFEITENSAIADFNKATGFINRLKQAGCEFALDDFGVGFASFSHLKNLNIQYLKIDGSFIKDITSQPRDKSIVEAMITVAQSLDIKTIAEWVETAETMELLRDLGVDYVQGYYLGKPELLADRIKTKN